MIIYKEELPKSDESCRLYKSTGWDSEDPKSEELLYNSIQSSWFVVSAYDGNKLVGIGRVISDGYLHAYINEMIIDPSFQRLGIGNKILKTLLDKIKQRGITDIQLFCAKGKKEFYLKNGFVERPQDAPGMQFNEINKK